MPIPAYLSPMPRLAIAQLRPTKGDYGANLQKIGGVLAQIAKLDPPADLVVFPETATSGYFVEGGVRDVAVTAGTLFRDLTVEHEAAGAPPVDVAIGFYEVFQNHFYNSCLYASLGNALPRNASSGNAAPGIRHVHRKVFLPTYGVFDEERFVDRGREIRAFDTRWGRAAILICEDAWHSLSGTIAALPGAEREVNLPHLIKSLGSGERGAGSRKRKRSVVQFDPATNGTAPRSPLPAPKIHVVGRGVEEGDPLQIDADLARRWLVSFLKDEVVRRRGFTKGIVGLSGGVDSSLTGFLAVEALGKENVIGVRMPYRTSSPESLEHALLVIQTLGIQAVTIDITAAVNGYLAQVEQNGDVDPTRRGNVMARERMIVLFDLSAKYKALPIGTSNKSERLLGYFTWHADDTPPVNPLGDLFKTQVRALARHVGVPEVILRKPPTPDLVPGQTTEGDYGISYDKVDRILYYLIRGMKPAEVVRRGFTPEEVDKVAGRLESTHWKRRLPTVAMMSQTAIGEFYLRPVDY